MIYALIYVILGLLSYFGFNKILSGSITEKVWYSVFWPATWIIVTIGTIKDKISK